MSLKPMHFFSQELEIASYTCNSIGQRLSNIRLDDLKDVKKSTFQDFRELTSIRVYASRRIPATI